MVDRKKLAEKGIDIEWKYRYKKVLSASTRALIYDLMLEPFKVRGLSEEILKDHPRIYELKKEPKNGYLKINELKGGATNSLVISNYERDGHLIHQGSDEKGIFYVFQPKSNEYDKINQLRKVDYVKGKLADLAKLQNDLKRVNPTPSFEELKGIESQIDEVFKEIFGMPNNEDKVEKEYESQLWFIAGVKFASGEIQALYKQGLSGPEITKKLKLSPNCRPYITTTLGGTAKGDKNIYSRKRSDLQKIYSYCQEKNIEIVEDFLNIYNSL